MAILYKFAYAESGYYRVVYRREHEGHRLVYCIQNDGAFGVDNFKFYRCSQDGEPDYEVKFPDPSAFDRLVYPDSLSK